MEYFEYLKKENKIELNAQQKSAVCFEKGNALVLSTAGSGKTTVIISRAGKLLYEGKCKKKILTITFSKMAANDMKNRFHLVFKDNYKNQAEFSTIHAFSYKIVKNYFNRKGICFNILKNNYQVLGEILRTHYSKSYFSYISDEEIENLSSKISFVNNMMINPKDYKDYGIEIKDFDLLYKKYSMHKSENKLIDFDDMLIYAYKILSSSEQYKKDTINTYEFIQIDEMQDTSKIQHELIKLISLDNLFMVGDDDQAIYSFRGSYPDFMIEFNNIYENGSVFYLDNNFRSDKNIVSGAKKFIEKNIKRFAKEIKTENESENQINIKRVNSRSEQSKIIVNELLQLGEKINNTVGILYRNNISAMLLANTLYENNIDFYLKEDKTKFFKSFVLHDILAFLNLALNPKNKEAFQRIYYKSYTYFTKNMCRIVMESDRDDLTVFEILDNCSEFDDYVYDKIHQFKVDINYINKLKPKEAIKFIKMDMEYMSYLDRMEQEGRINKSNSMHILEILEEIGFYSDNTKQFINNIYNLQDVLENASQNTNSKITLTTIHSAKGLEYDYVYMIDNTDKEFPPEKKHMTDTEYRNFIEEERRVFYVGMTRAKKMLNIIVPLTPSLFVNELINTNKPAIDYDISQGQEVIHNKYGKGVIIDINENIVTIKFYKSKTRNFNLRFLLENKILQIL